MQATSLTQSRSGLGPFSCCANPGVAYFCVATLVSASESWGAPDSNVEVFDSPNSAIEPAGPEVNGEPDIPKYIVPPRAVDQSSGSALTGCSVYAASLYVAE